MSSFDNNQFEVKPNTKSKRKITTPCPNAYLNPGLDLLANEDPICNTVMEIVPVKKRKRSKSCCDIAAFENTGLDVNRPVVNEFLARELDNVRKTMKSCENIPFSKSETLPRAVETEQIDGPANPTSTNSTSNLNNMEMSVIEEEVNCSDAEMEAPMFQPDISDIAMDSICPVSEQNMPLVPLNMPEDKTSVQKNITNQVIFNNTSNINLSFIDRLVLDSPNLSNQSLYLDDDLNESNIMEIKTITIITKKKRVIEKKKITNPFLDPCLNEQYTVQGENPFLMDDESRPQIEYNHKSNVPVEVNMPHENNLLPRRLFVNDNNSTISTVNESMNPENHEYENIDNYRSESPIYENISGDIPEPNINKQSKILGHDVSRFSAIDIMNLNKNSKANSSNESNDSKKDLKHQFLRASNRLSKRVFKTLKKTFKHEKVEQNVTLNPYEVPRKPPKQKVQAKDSGIENPALHLDNSDEIEIEDLDDDEHQYETVKTLRNTQLNMNVTPLKERLTDNFDTSQQSKHNTPGKKVRFDSTLNQEKVITGNSFDCTIQSPGFNAKIDNYHNELENCINERKFIQQNM